MKSFNKILAVAAVSMTALAGVTAQAAEPWSGEQPVFSDFKYAVTGAVNAADVQAQAHQAIQSYAFNDQMTGYVQAQQGAGLSRAQVQAQAAEAMRTQRLEVGE